MTFTYVATSKAGKKLKGTLEAKTRANAVKDLKERGLTVVSIDAVHVAKIYYVGGVSNLQKVVFTKNLAVLLKAGVGIDEAIEILSEQAAGRLKPLLLRVREEVLGGSRLADALASFPKTFNPYFISMVRAGEESGTLSENLESLAVRYAKDYEIKKKAQSALMYPALDSVVGTSQVLGTAGSGCDSTCTLAGTELAACTDLTSALVPTYLSAIPIDPNTGTAANTDYVINKTAGGRILVSACDPELSIPISVQR